MEGEAHPPAAGLQTHLAPSVSAVRKFNTEKELGKQAPTACCTHAQFLLSVSFWRRRALRVQEKFPFGAEDARHFRPGS